MKAAAAPNMPYMTVTRETCGGGNVDTEIATVARASIDQIEESSGPPPVDPREE